MRAEVAAVDVIEQEASAALGGAGLLAGGFGGAGQGLEVEPVAGLEGGAGGAGASLVGAEKAGQEDPGGGLAKLRIAQGRQCGGQTVREREQGGGGGFDRPEGPFQRALGLGIGFSLRGMLDVECLERLAWAR
jgi:hypothetical protein